MPGAHAISYMKDNAYAAIRAYLAASNITCITADDGCINFTCVPDTLVYAAADDAQLRVRTVFMRNIPSPIHVRAEAFLRAVNSRLSDVRLTLNAAERLVSAESSLPLEAALPGEPELKRTLLSGSAAIAKYGKGITELIVNPDAEPETIAQQLREGTFTPSGELAQQRAKKLTADAATLSDRLDK